MYLPVAHVSMAPELLPRNNIMQRPALCEVLRKQILFSTWILSASFAISSILPSSFVMPIIFPPQPPQESSFVPRHVVLINLPMLETQELSTHYSLLKAHYSFPGDVTLAMSQVCRPPPGIVAWRTAVSNNSLVKYKLFSQQLSLAIKLA